METLSPQPVRFSLPPVFVAAPAADNTIFLVSGAARAGSPVKSALEARGYQVIQADSMEGALRVWMTLAARIDLFLADISMGRNHGVGQLVKLLQAENPRMRVLYANDLEQTTGPVMLGQTYAKQLVDVVDNCLA